MLAAAAPFWAVALRKVRQSLSQRTVPVLALFAAFSFVTMMFNIPLPGGTTAHAVGGTLLAIVLGPWAAVIGLSVVLGIQALFFGDGGVLALGANCFNMAILLPLVGYFTYRVISGGSAAASPRRLLGAVAGSYAGLNAAALFTAIELGLQPLLFHAADGTPLYAPYNLATALPSVMAGHLLVAGPVEALVTGLVLFYLQRAHSSLLPGGGESGQNRRWIMWGALAVLALIAPLGLLASGTAWGEWGLDELTSLGLGSIPQGLQKLTGWWPAPLPDYGLPRLGAAMGYILSALLGVALIIALLWLVGRWIVRRRNAVESAAPMARYRGKEGFLTRNIAGLSQALESVIAADDQSRLPGLLQSLDPRLKLTAFLLLVICAGLAGRLWLLAILLGLVLSLVLLSRIRLSFFLKRVLLFIPLFTLVIALPALFITPGTALWQIGSHLSITSQGLTSAVFLCLRVTVSLSLGMLLVLTTRWNDLLAALRWLRLPSLVVSIVGMTYRYVFLFLHTANSMFLARRSRTVAYPSGADNRRWLTQALVTTLSKSQHLGEEVYQAMLSRGYSGQMIVLDKLQTRRRDLLAAAFTCGMVAILMWVNYI